MKEEDLIVGKRYVLYETYKVKYIIKHLGGFYFESKDLKGVCIQGIGDSVEGLYGFTEITLKELKEL